ncbi:hypothetical protein [Kocuria palustris]|uniref:hypothetical protein n=1 Tax=Kocuria palustris TaxID=71999 RepID=UPI003CEB610B
MTEQPEHPVYDQQDYQDILNALRAERCSDMHFHNHTQRSSPIMANFTVRVHPRSSDLVSIARRES